MQSLLVKEIFTIININNGERNDVYVYKCFFIREKQLSQNIKIKTSCAKPDIATTPIIRRFQFRFVNCPQNPVALCSDCNNAQQSGSPPSGANRRVFPLSPSLRTI